MKIYYGKMPWLEPGFDYQITTYPAERSVKFYPAIMRERNKRKRARMVKQLHRIGVTTFHVIAWEVQKQT